MPPASGGGEVSGGGEEGRGGGGGGGGGGGEEEEGGGGREGEEKERLRRVPRPGGSNPPASAPTGPSVFGAGATVFPPFRANPSPRRGLPAVGPRTVLTVEQWRRWEHEEAEKEKKRKRDGIVVE